jgi:hypothetical protein
MLDLSKLCKEEVDEIIAYYKGFQKWLIGFVKNGKNFFIKK